MEEGLVLSTGDTSNSKDAWVCSVDPSLKRSVKSPPLLKSHSPLKGENLEGNSAIVNNELLNRISQAKKPLSYQIDETTKFESLHSEGNASRLILH